MSSSKVPSARDSRGSDGATERLAPTCSRARTRRRRRSSCTCGSGRVRASPARRASATVPRPPPLAAERDHVRRDVAPVDVEPGTKIGDQQPAGPAADIERRLTALLDVPLEVGDLVRPEVVVELRPPLRDQAVVPRLRSAFQSSTSWQPLLAGSSTVEGLRRCCSSRVRVTARSGGSGRWSSRSRRDWPLLG
jgi:hypothetical protein